MEMSMRKNWSRFWLCPIPKTEVNFPGKSNGNFNEPIVRILEDTYGSAENPSNGRSTQCADTTLKLNTTITDFMIFVSISCKTAQKASQIIGMIHRRNNHSRANRSMKTRGRGNLLNHRSPWINTADFLNGCFSREELDEPWKEIAWDTDIRTVLGVAGICSPGWVGRPL